MDAGGLPCDVDPNLPMPIRGLREIAFKTKDVAYDNAFPESPWMKYMPEGHVRLDNVLFAPLNIEDKTVGVIGIANKPGGFNKYDINISRILGDLAAVALTYAKSQESLKESEEKFRSLVEKLDDIIWTTDMELQIVYVSPSIEKKLGFTQEKRMAQKVEETMTPVSLEKATEIFIRELEKERKGGMDPDRTFRIELEYLHKNGTPIWFENVIGWQRDKTGEIIGIQGVSRDISERKQSEKILLQQQKTISMNNRIAGIFLTSSSENLFADVLDVLLEELESSYGYFGYIDEAGDLVCPSMTRNIWDQCELPQKDIVFPQSAWGGAVGSVSSGENNSTRKSGTSTARRPCALTKCSGCSHCSS